MVDEGIEYIIRTDKASLDACVALPFSSMSFPHRLCDLGWMSGAQTNTVKCDQHHALWMEDLSRYQSGLTQACLDSLHSHDEVSQAVLAYIKKWVPRRHVGILAGNSVHADRLFLAKYMPEVVEWLHYRSLGPFGTRSNC